MKKEEVASGGAPDRPDSIAKASYSPPRIRHYGSVSQITGSDKGGSNFDSMFGNFTAKMG